MVFGPSLPTRGLEISQILSDETHYGTFICGTCEKLVSLDAVVTTSCRHPHCRKCIENASTEAFMRQKPCQCPKCDENIQHQPQFMPTDCMQFGATTVMVRPLPLAEPLAFQCLRKVRVACCGCNWQGAYGDYLQHAVIHAFQQPISSAAVVKEQQTFLQHPLRKPSQKAQVEASIPHNDAVDEAPANPELEISADKESEPHHVFVHESQQTDSASPAVINDAVSQSVPEPEAVSKQCLPTVSPIMPHLFSGQRIQSLVRCEPSPQLGALLQTAQPITGIAIPKEIRQETPKISDIRSFWKVRERKQQKLTGADETDIFWKDKEKPLESSLLPSIKKSSSNRNLIRTMNDEKEDDIVGNILANNIQENRKDVRGGDANIKFERSDQSTKQSNNSSVGHDDCRIPVKDENHINQSSGFSVHHHTRPSPESERNGNCHMPLGEQQPQRNLGDWEANDTANIQCGEIPIEKVHVVVYDNTSTTTIIQPSVVDQSLQLMRDEKFEQWHSNPQLSHDKRSSHCSCELTEMTPARQLPVEHEHGVRTDRVHSDHHDSALATYADKVLKLSQYPLHSNLKSGTSTDDSGFYHEASASQGGNATLDASVNYRGPDVPAQAPSLQQHGRLSHQSHETNCQSQIQIHNHNHPQHVELDRRVILTKERYLGQDLAFDELQLQTSASFPSTEESDESFEVGATSALVGGASKHHDNQSCAGVSAEKITGLFAHICDTGANAGAELSIQQSLESSGACLDKDSIENEIELANKASTRLAGRLTDSADAVGEPESCRQSLNQPCSLLSIEHDSRADELSTFIDQKNKKRMYDSSGQLIVNPLDCESFYESDLSEPEDLQHLHLVIEDDDGSVEEIVEDKEDGKATEVEFLEKSTADDDDGSIGDFTSSVSKDIPYDQHDVKDNAQANQHRIMNASIDSLGFSDRDLDDCTDRQDQVPQHRQMRPSVNSVGFSENDLNASLNNGFSDEDSLECCADIRNGACTQTINTAEKLKKQANAKFNQSDLAGARALYSKGITILENSQLQESAHNLLSGMFANRSVTYYRQKHFERAIEDCDAAIKYNSSDDKARIRKWRAMMALGKCEEAFVYIQMGLRDVPSSNKIELQCQKSRKEMVAYSKVKGLMETGDIKMAKQVLGEVMDSSENLFLLILTARVDTALGDFDGAFEKINRSLKINPNYVDALELCGFMYFIQGDTKKASDLLLEAYSNNPESAQLKAALRRVQRTHLAYSDARGAVQRGAYKEAAEKFSAAIKESAPLPPVAPLYSILRTERADSNLLGHQFVPALKDCQDVTSVSPKHAHAWVIRAKVLFALGKIKDAKKELDKIRRLIGNENPLVEESYQNIDFELRARTIDGDLIIFQKELESGTCSRLPPSDNIETSDRKKTYSNMPRHSVKSISKQNNTSADTSFTGSISSNTEWNASTSAGVIDEVTLSSLEKKSIVDQSNRELPRKEKAIPSVAHWDSTRNSSSRKDSAQFLRDESTSSERRDRAEREYRYRVDRDRRGLSASNNVDRKNGSDGDRRRSDDSNGQQGSREIHDRRTKYIRSEGSSRKLSSDRSDETDHNDKSDTHREGERRRSDDRGGSRRSTRPEDDGRRSIRASDVSRKSFISHPSQDESIKAAKHSTRRSSFHSHGKDGRGYTRRDSDLTREGQTDDQQQNSSLPIRQSSNWPTR